jgi:hypothetical protein
MHKAITEKQKQQQKIHAIQLFSGIRNVGKIASFTFTIFVLIGKGIKR